MTIKKLTAILENHSINYEIINGRVIAEECYTLNGLLYTDKIDLTDISLKQLYEWLGY